MNARRTIRTARRAVYWAGVAAAMVCGCSPGAKFAEVEGVVTVDGRPVEWVEVVFLPDPGEGTRGTRASCYTDAQGRYRLCTSGADGAIVGKHRVVFQDTNDVAGPDGLGGADDPATHPETTAPAARRATPRRGRLAEQYMLPDRTPFRAVEVHDGHQTLDFALSSTPARK